MTIFIIIYVLYHLFFNAFRNNDNSKWYFMYLCRFVPKGLKICDHVPFYVCTRVLVAVPRQATSLPFSTFLNVITFQTLSSTLISLMLFTMEPVYCLYIPNV